MTDQFTSRIWKIQKKSKPILMHVKNNKGKNKDIKQ